ncbi:MAG: GAF domain-containing protein [Anaerolineae bacterium]
MTEPFRHLFDSLKEEVVVIDRDLRISYANAAWLQRAGASLTQVLGQPCHTVLLDSEAACDPATCIARQVIRSGEPAEWSCPGRAENDDTPQRLISASPVLDESGQVIQVIQLSRPPDVQSPNPQSVEHQAISIHQHLTEVLHKAALLANSGQGLQAVLDEILDQLRRVVNFDSASIILLEKRGWRLIAGRGLPPDLELGKLVFPPQDEKVKWLQTHQQPLIIPDVHQDPLWRPVKETRYIRAWMGAPLLMQGQMIGTLNVDKRVPDYYTEQDARLVMVFANQAAIAVENARLLDAERARSAQMRLLSDLGQRVLSILDPEALLDYAVRAIGQQFGYYHVDVFLVDDDGQRVLFKASSDPQNARHWRAQNMSFQVGGQGIIGHVAASGEPYLAVDVSQDPRYVPDGLLPETRSELAMPIKVGDRVIGVLDLNSNREDDFDEDDLFVTRGLADQLAVGLENARLYEAAERRVAEMEAVRRASLSLTSSLELADVLDTILETSMELASGAKDAHIFLYDGARLRFGAALWADGRKGTPWAEPRPGGLTYTVAQSGEMIVVPDMQNHPLFDQAPDSWEGAIVGMPLRMGARVVGVMSVAYSRAGQLSEAELRILRLLADQAAIAIENARLFTAERQSWMRLQSIQATSTALGSHLDLDTLPARIVDEAARSFQADAVSLMLWDQEQKYLTIRASHGLSASYARQQRISHDQVYEAHLSNIQSGEPLYISDLTQQPIGQRSLIEEEGIRSVLVVPMLVHGQPTGALNIYSKEKPRRFGSAEIELSRIFAAQAAVMIANAELLAAEAHRRREAETLQAAIQALSRSIDLPEILRVILTELQKVVPYDSATVQALEGHHLRIIGGDGFPNLEELMGLEFDVKASDNPNCEVVRKQAPLILGDAPLQYKEFKREPHAQAGIRSWLGIPLLFGDRLIGMLALDKRQPHFYSQEHARLAMAFAAQAAIAIHNARLYLETQERLRDLSLLFDASAALSTTLDVDRVLETIARHIRAALNTQGCAISLWAPERDELVTLLDHSDNPEWWEPEPAGTVYTLDNYPTTRQVLTSRQPKVIQASDPGADPSERAWMLAENVKSLLMVPMVVRDKVVGLLELMEAQAERVFTPTEISLCQTLANQAAAALDNARLFQETEVRAREMEALVAVSRAMTTLELDDVLDSIAENALQAANTEISSVYLLEEGTTLVPRSVRGINWKELETASFKVGEGTIGRVAESGQPLVVQNTTAEQAFVPKTGAAHVIHNVLTVPLIVKKRVIGTLEVCNKAKEGDFTQTDQRLLTAFADQAAIAIENARLYQEISHHLEEVQILNKVAQAATSTLDFDEVIRRGVAALFGVRNFERVNILLLEQETHELCLHPALSGSPILPRRADIRIPLGTGITGRVAQTGKPLRVADIRQEAEYVAGYPDSLSELAVPLRIGDRVVGVLDVQSTRPNAFSESDERLLSTLSGQMSTLLENSRLFAETQQRVRELTALMDVSRALNQAEGLETILSIVLDEAFNLIGSQEGTVILIDPPGSNRLRIVAERGLGAEKVEAFNTRPVYAHEGTYRRALRRGEMVEVADTQADADFLDDVGSRAKSVTNIPLVAERGPIGLIAVDGLPRDDTTRRLLAALAGMAAVAIDKERLHQETANRLAEVSTLYTLSTQITTSLSLNAVLEAIVSILRLTLDCRSCSIFLLDPTGEFLQLEAGSGPSSTWKGIARLRVGEGISGRVIDERRSIYIPDTQIEPDFIFFDPQIRSLLVVPLVVRSKAVGTLSIDDTRTNAFDDEVRLLTIAAAQAAVAIENAQLYESLQKSYQDLEQAYEDLRELDKMKSELIQNISHELRTPLTFIKGYVELLQDGEMGPLQEAQQSALDIVSNKAEALSRLVDDIISMQQVSREQLRLESLNLGYLGRVALQAALVSAQEAGLTLVDELSEDVPQVWGDQRRLGQVFDNLLQNAIKFSHPGGTITLRTYSQEGMVRTEVQDTGIGIAADQLARIFDRFYQVDGTTTRRFGGTGLGLAIVKQIVESHGGQVGVESEPGQGSLFYFTIPPADRKQQEEL